MNWKCRKNMWNIICILKDQYLSVASLNTPVGEDENSELIEFISGNDELSAEEIIILKSLKESIGKAIIKANR